MTENQKKPWNGYPTFAMPGEKAKEKATEPQFDTFYTDYPVCPWCGHEHRDASEFDDGEYDCERCEKSFYCSREVSVNFTTGKAKEDSNATK